MFTRTKENCVYILYENIIIIKLPDHLWNILCQPIGSKHTNRSTLCIYTCLFVVSRWHKWTRGNYPWPLWPYKTQALLLGFPRRPAGHWSGKARQAVYPLGKSIEATYNVSAFKHKLNNWCGLTTGISHSNTCWLFLETAAEMYIQHMLIPLVRCCKMEKIFKNENEHP